MRAHGKQGDAGLQAGIVALDKAIAANWQEEVAALHAHRKPGRWPEVKAALRAERRVLQSRRNALRRKLAQAAATPKRKAPGRRAKATAGAATSPSAALNGAELERLCEAAFGGAWKTPVAAVGCSREMLWRYATGRAPVPAAAVAKIRALPARHRAALGELARNHVDGMM